MDKLARFILTAFIACIADPIGKAVPAETRKPHQFNVLCIVPVAQMLDQAAKGSSSGGIIKRIERIIVGGHRAFP